MHITILTNEYPPNTYGGAGVHVEYLTRELAALEGGTHEVQVLSFGQQRVTEGNLKVHGVEVPAELPVQDARHRKFMDTMARDLEMAGRVADTDIVHCHTWYSHLAGCLAKQLAGAKLVVTTHSLEPHRPWKVEQLGTAYHASSWVERTAYENADGVIAVSSSMATDVQSLYDVPADRVRRIYNGIDLQQYQPTLDVSVLAKHDIDPEEPFVLFVGRITRQKGILHLVNAIQHLEPGTQVVLCAGAPDTEEIANEMETLVAEARKAGSHRIIWIDEMLPKDEVITLYSHAAVFCCPSVYEPFGIINLEAMACKTPVVASAVGGIPEVVVPDETGLLVSFDPVGSGDFEPADPEGFSRALADGLNALLTNPARREQMAEASRQRVEEHFSWTHIAEHTLDFYRDLLAGTPERN